MSLPFSAFWFDKNAGLMSGGDMSGKPTFADLLEEQFGLPNAPGVDGLDELFDELEAWLEEDDDSPAPGPPAH